MAVLKLVKSFFMYRQMNTISVVTTRSRTSKLSISLLRHYRKCFPADDPRRANVSTDLITYVEDRGRHDRRYAIAPDKIKKEVGWEPETMFKEGIRKTIAWFFEHED